MWLGAVAGLALLTLSNLARPIHALVTLADNQQLRYGGDGWQSSDGPQVCNAVSQTVHTTNTTGNFLTFNFTGNALSVLGPPTSLLSPMTAILDGTVQRVPLSTQADDSGCGILYSIENLNNSPHTLVLIYHAQSGSVDFSVSGISVTIPDAAMTQASPTLLQVSSNKSLSASSITTSAPLSTASTNVSSASANSSTPANTVAAPTSSAASASSAVATSAAFATTPGMTVGLVAAIIGTIIAMFTLLMFFIVVRRRITSTSARKMDQENNFGRDHRGHQMDDGKSNLVVQDASWPILAGGKKTQLPVFDMQGDAKRSGAGVTAFSGASPSASFQAAVASGSDVHPGFGITSPSPRGDRFTRASVYSGNFGTTFSSRGTSQQFPEAVVPWTSTPDPDRQKPLPLTISVPSPNRSHSRHGLAASTVDTTSPRQSPDAPPLPWFSRDATRAPSTNDLYAAQNGDGANVVTGAGRGTDLPPRPPGFF